LTSKLPEQLPLPLAITESPLDFTIDVMYPTIQSASRQPNRLKIKQPVEQGLYELHPEPMPPFSFPFLKQGLILSKLITSQNHRP
jgi:hypothetical protein